MLSPRWRLRHSTGLRPSSHHARARRPHADWRALMHYGVSSSRWRSCRCERAVEPARVGCEEEVDTGRLLEDAQRARGGVRRLWPRGCGDGEVDAHLTLPLAYRASWIGASYNRTLLLRRASIATPRLRCQIQSQLVSRVQNFGYLCKPCLPMLAAPARGVFFAAMEEGDVMRRAPGSRTRPQVAHGWLMIDLSGPASRSDRGALQMLQVPRERACTRNQRCAVPGLTAASVAYNYNLRNRSTSPGRLSIPRQRKPLCDFSRLMDLLKKLNQGRPNECCSREREPHRYFRR